MNYEDLKPCPICGRLCSSITIERNEYGYMCGERIGVVKGRFECACCGSTIYISGDSVKQVYEKWNNIARK